MFPHVVTEDADNDFLLKVYPGETAGFCRVGDHRWFLPISYGDHAQGYYQFRPKEDDVWIVTFPRSGTTMTQELIWLICNNCDFDSAAKTPLYDRVPFFEYNIFHTEAKHRRLSSELGGLDREQAAALSEARVPGYLKLDHAPSPRLIKTHLPFSLLPPELDQKGKIIYVARNPKDAAVSYYYHNRLIKFFDFKGDFQQYWSLFTNGQIVHGPYWPHIKEGWERRHQENVKFLFYENMVKDLRGTIVEICKFLDKPIPNDETMERLVDHMKIDNFKKNVTVRRAKLMDGLMNQTGQGFIRSGQIGGNKEFDEELEKEADEWIKINQDEIGISFPQ